MIFDRRTDLALEACERWNENRDKNANNLNNLNYLSELQGVKASRRRVEGYYIDIVEILDQVGADVLGKPMGNYITIDLSGFWDRKPDFFERAVMAVGKELKNLMPDTGGALVIGLGNAAMTPDAIGPLAADYILITRNLINNMPKRFAGFREAAAWKTGVAGTTGIESAEAVRGLIDQIHPAVVIAIDALAARKRERLCNTIQICDSGISPGSGVGNDRNALNYNSMGVPVIAIGVPTVIDAATLAADLLEEYAGDQIADILRDKHGGLMVTPKEIDGQVRDLAKVIGYGVNWSLQDLEISDMADLLS